MRESGSPVAMSTFPKRFFCAGFPHRERSRTAKYSDAYSDEERRTIAAAFGTRIDASWQTMQQIYLEQKPAVTFVTYGGVGHGTDGRINRDVANFFDSILRRMGGPQSPGG